MAVLTDFRNYIDAYYELWAENIRKNQKQAEIREQVLRQLHGLMDSFMLAGRDSEYDDALKYYQDMLTLLSVAEDDDAWDVGIAELETFFSVGNTPFATAVFANPLNLDVSAYRDWIVNITDNTTINIINATNGMAGMIELIYNSTGGQTVTFGTTFTKRVGANELYTYANADNIISWRCTGSDIIYTLDVVV